MSFQAYQCCRKIGQNPNNFIAETAIDHTAPIEVNLRKVK